MENLKLEPAMVRIEIDINKLVPNGHLNAQDSRRALANVADVVRNSIERQNSKGWHHRPKKFCEKLKTNVQGKEITFGRVFFLPERLKTPQRWYDVERDCGTVKVSAKPLLRAL